MSNGMVPMEPDALVNFAWERVQEGEDKYAEALKEEETAYQAFVYARTTLQRLRDGLEHRRREYYRIRDKAVAESRESD